MAISKVRTPRKKTVDKVLLAVKNKGGMNRKLIMLESNLTGHCVDLCLDALIISKKVSRSFVRMSGPYKVYSYSSCE